MTRTSSERSSSCLLVFRSLAQLKLHETATVTLALKNIAMSFPAADHYGHPRSKRRHHNEFFADMHSFIAAMAKRFPIDVAFIAGHPAMIGTGPLGGHTVETGLVIASVDPLAAVWIASGLWPIVHMRSFEAVAGRKRDKWLVASWLFERSAIARGR